MDRQIKKNTHSVKYINDTNKTNLNIPKKLGRLYERGDSILCNGRSQKNEGKPSKKQSEELKYRNNYLPQVKKQSNDHTERQVKKQTEFYHLERPRTYKLLHTENYYYKRPHGKNLSKNLQELPNGKRQAANCNARPPPQPISKTEECHLVRPSVKNQDVTDLERPPIKTLTENYRSEELRAKNQSEKDQERLQAKGLPEEYFLERPRPKNLSEDYHLEQPRSKNLIETGLERLYGKKQSQNASGRHDVKKPTETHYLQQARAKKFPLSNQELLQSKNKVDNDQTERPQIKKLSASYHNVEKINVTKKQLGNDTRSRYLQDIQGRKLLREKYTVKLKPLKNDVKKEDNNIVEQKSNKNVEDAKKCLTERVTQTIESSTTTSAKADSTKTKLSDDTTKSKLSDDTTKSKLSDDTTKSKKSEDTTKTKKSDSSKKPDKQVTKLRKPIIKTVMSKTGDVRFYKAVTFVDKKPSLCTPLQISIPSNYEKQTISKATDTSSLKSKVTDSHVSILEKRSTARKRNEKKRKPRDDPSPEARDKEPEMTEVARWAPSCINNQTQPYYEAWINTTLAAISKDKKILDNKTFLKRLRKAFVERPKTPDLFFDPYYDEKYTGRIKINKR